MKIIPYASFFSVAPGIVRISHVHPHQNMTSSFFNNLIFFTACQIVSISAQVFIDDFSPSFRVMNFYESSVGKFFSKPGSTLSFDTAQKKKECSFKCLQQQDCLSVNVLDFGKSSYHCELLNWTGTALDKYLTNRTNSWLMQREVGIRSRSHKIPDQ